MFTFSVKLEKWSFHVANLPRTGKKCTEIKKAREGRAKLLFLFICGVVAAGRRVVDLKLPDVSGSVLSSWRLRFTWLVAFTYYLLCPERFSPVSVVFPSFHKPAVSKSNYLWKRLAMRAFCVMSIAKNPSQQTTVPCFH